MKIGLTVFGTSSLITVIFVEIEGVVTMIVVLQVQAGGAAILTCPAYFSDDQREAVAVAGEDAGMVVLDTIEEPTVSIADFAHTRC